MTKVIAPGRESRRRRYHALQPLRARDRVVLLEVGRRRSQLVVQLLTNRIGRCGHLVVERDVPGHRAATRVTIPPKLIPMFAAAVQAAATRLRAAQERRCRDMVLRLLARGQRRAWQLWAANVQSGRRDRAQYDRVLAGLVADGLVNVEYVPNRNPRYTKPQTCAVYRLAAAVQEHELHVREHVGDHRAERPHHERDPGVVERREEDVPEDREDERDQDDHGGGRDA